MVRNVSRIGMLVVTGALALAPPPSEAIAPALLLIINQVAQQVAQSMVKNAILSSLSGMGCKGIALSNALEALDARSGSGALLGGLPQMPAGFTMPTLPAGMTLPTGANMPSMAGMPNMPDLTGVPGGVGLPIGGLPGMNVPPDMLEKMRKLMPNGGELPADLGLDPDQMAMMAQMQQAMSRPLSPPETLATIDELTELGFLPKPMQAELKECMVLVPASIPALGMGMGMFKPIIPQLQQAREEMHALSPEEQDEVATSLVKEMSSLPADQRASLVEYMDSGFFPPRIADQVKAGLR